MTGIILKWNYFYDSITKWVPQFLNFEVFTIDKTPVTLGKLIAGLLILIFGRWAIKQLAQQIDKKILSHFDIEPAFRHTTMTFSFYIMLLLLFLFVLRLLGIPLTVFTIVGGALAVGIGFGSQSIVYDLLSGLVMIIEHPIRKGDFIELENVRGHVEHIGARATRVHTVDNKHLIVPNNFFLSKIVLNWTLSDKIIRSDFAVGVVYGSPVSKVVKLIEQAIREHVKIEKNPAPIILFSDFGDNALVFRIHFWAAVYSLMDINILQSDLRFRIDTLFNENGIVIAFPQRDLHLKSASAPIQVEVLSQKSRSQTTSPKAPGL